jgi:hypothetical protein
MARIRELPLENLNILAPNQNPNPRGLPLDTYTFISPYNKCHTVRSFLFPQSGLPPETYTY